MWVLPSHRLEEKLKLDLLSLWPATILESKTGVQHPQVSKIYRCEQNPLRLPFSALLEYCKQQSLYRLLGAGATLPVFLSRHVQTNLLLLLDQLICKPWCENPCGLVAAASSLWIQPASMHQACALVTLLCMLHLLESMLP